MSESETAKTDKKMNFLARGAIGLVKLYRRYISPLSGPTCRYYPTCSQYAIDAITAYGFFKGGAKAFWRVMRCNPWSKGGYDPAVPVESAVNIIDAEEAVGEHEETHTATDDSVGSVNDAKRTNSR